MRAQEAKPVLHIRVYEMQRWNLQ